MHKGSERDLDALFNEEFGIGIRHGVGSHVNIRLLGIPRKVENPDREAVFLTRIHKHKRVVIDVFSEPDACTAVEALARIIHLHRWETEPAAIFRDEVPDEVQLSAVRWVAENGGLYDVSIAMLEKAIRPLPVVRSARLLEEAIRHLTTVLDRGPRTVETLNPKLGRLGDLLESAPPASELAIDMLGNFAHNLGLVQLEGIAPLRSHFVTGLQAQWARTADKNRRAAFQGILKTLEPNPAVLK
jgi:hypothetical protein